MKTISSKRVELGVEAWFTSGAPPPPAPHRFIRLVVWLSVGSLLGGLRAVEAETFSIVYNFSNLSRPGAFARPLCTGNTLYGLGPGTYNAGSIFRINLDGTGYSTLKSFPATVYDGIGASTNSDGAGPLGGVIADGDLLYGTAALGGHYGMGTVFSVRTNGMDFTVLKNFSGPDGKAPYAELLLVSNVLYGTTAAGGDYGKGTVFRLSTDSLDFRLLHSFDRTNGLLPLGGLTLSDGVLYGTTVSGGAWTNGTVFSIHPDGSDFTVLKEFTGADGAAPRHHLVVAGNWIYGTTEGVSMDSLVYRLSTDGMQYDILKTFSPPDPISGTNSDGYWSQSGLESSGGALFGSTREGGYYGSGTLFALRMDGSTYTVLHHFAATTNNGPGVYVNSDGVGPGPLALYGGILYGTPESGGSVGFGTVATLDIRPRIELPGSGMGQDSFEFDVVGYSNQVVSVEACTNVATPVWRSLATSSIGAGPAHFVDSDSRNRPCCVYRLKVE